MNEQVLLKELIRIPERVHQGDFVLKLTEGVRNAEGTVRDYVVTPQLRRCFDEALAFIQGAIESRSSKACYLHGSFGAGKSHFMAVLNLLLAGDVRARSIPELADVVARHNAWTEGRRFLMVPYHMIGARDMESAVLGQYAEYVRHLHPDAPVPGFYLAESLFDDARRLRAQIGDEAFFARLNEGGAGGDGWGALETGWDPVSFESAMLEPPQGEERQRLVGDLIGRFFASYSRVAGGRGESFVALDEGLSIMTQHARRLGYDAVILFLDELILWLATRAADVNFVASEGQKLVKLVEAQRSDRPIPLVSFVARQRDLRDLVGDNLAGALQLQFADVLKHWEARFHRITLEDRNLPVIAQKRLLQPVSEAARQTLDAAFEEVAGRRQDVLETLLGSTGERAMFRQVYPFSPALVQTLIAVSSLLQRERTALKIMLQLLVDRRQDLELGMLIPVGDLWDVIAQGDEPFTDATRIQFENAKKLWTQKFLPLLERQHGVGWQELQEGTAEPRAASNLRNDARLLKTLLLAALVPQVEALKALTPPRLAALNHGSVRSPIPGLEGNTVLTKLRQWAAEVGEIKITEDSNPVITVQITGVDTEPILADARQYDSEGNRRRKIREMLFQELGMAERSDFFTEYAFLWRGTRRQIDVLHDNVFELADDRLRGRPGAWTVVLGLPFDDARRTPADTRARLGRFTERAETLVWLPSHFSDKAKRELGTLVMLDYLLTGERFEDAARHLSAVDREQARALLRNQRSQLQQRLRNCIEVAYGIASEPRDAVESPLEPTDHLRSLDGTFNPQVPVGANLKEAFERLLDQLFTHRFPAHPPFDQEIRPSHLKAVYAVLRQAIGSPDHRVPVTDKGTRQIVAAIANPLRLGSMAATHFLLHDHWPTHFARLHAQHGGPMTVKRLREWTDEPRPMGLTREVQNLIILTYAEQTNRSFFHRGVAVRPELERLDDELELREQALPPAEAWTRARARAGELFGLTPPEVLNAANVERLLDGLLERARATKDPLARFARVLEARLTAYDIRPDGADRLVTTRSAMALLAEIEAAGEASEAVERLAAAEIRTSEAAMAGTLARAAELDSFVTSFDWLSVETAGKLADHRRAAADALRARVGEALAADEHVVALRSALEQVRAKALRLLADTGQPRPHPHQAPGPVEPGDGAEEVIFVEERRDLPIEDALALLAELERRLQAERDGRLSISCRLTRRSRTG